MNMPISVRPEYGANYKLGDIGFTFIDDNFISLGVAWFTKWDQGKNTDVPDVPVTHCFIVSGEDECIDLNIADN